MSNKVTKLKAAPDQLKLDLQKQLEAMVKAQADKLAQSKAHLIAQLEMASKKYLTVNGYMQARSTIEQVAFGKDVSEPDELACIIAREMSELAWTLAEEIEEADVTELTDAVLDAHVNLHFVTSEPTFNETVQQLLIVNLMQNVGPVLDDIISFRDSTDGDIKSITAAIEGEKHEDADAVPN